MKKLLTMVALLIAGCTDESPIPANKLLPGDTGMSETLKVYSLRHDDPRNTLIVLNYGGRKHVFLVHTTKYDHGGPIACSESMVKVGEYELDAK